MVSLGVFTSCSDDDVPEAENEEELITKVELLFSPNDGGDPITVNAIDPDGEGPESIEPSGSIVLAANTSYQLFLSLENTVNGEDITEEVEEESDEHMFFFEFTEGLFSSPEGNGNVDSRDDAVNYLDEDVNGLDLGLVTAWITAGAGESGEFRVVLKHQPGIKSETSESSDGESDVDITWDIEIQ